MTFSEYYVVIMASVTIVFVIKELVKLAEYLIERWDDKNV